MTSVPYVTKNGIIRTVPESVSKDVFDWKSLRWNGEEHHGWTYGRFFQSVPMFFTAEGHNLWLGDLYRGRSVFLIASGTSLKRYDLSKLRQPGIVTLGLNNSPRVFRPQLWTCVDSPSNFMRSIWLDPSIMKFVPLCATDKLIFDNDSIVKRDQQGRIIRDERGNPKLFDDLGRFVKHPATGADLRVRDCPNVVYYRRNEFFQASQFLWEDTFNWGNHGDFGGGRSVLLVAIRLAYVLGFRRVFLLGVDFDMSSDRKYSFEQDRTESSIKGNQATYQKLIQRFSELKPIFDREGFEVYQCNHASHLKVFPHIPYDDALQLVREEFWHGATPINIDDENTYGLYDREDRLKKAAAKSARADKQRVEALLKPGGARVVGDVELKTHMVLPVDQSAAPPVRYQLKPKSSATSFASQRREYTEEEKRDVKRRLDILRRMLNQAKEDLARLENNPPSDPNNDAMMQAWIENLENARGYVEQLRIAFRTVEDEKRWKHGEPIRWGLWNPENEGGP